MTPEESKEKAQLLPHWLPGWGVLGAVLSVAAVVLASFARDFGMESVHTYLSIPIGLNELVFAVWLLAKGFNQDAVRKLDETQDSLIHNQPSEDTHLSITAETL